MKAIEDCVDHKNYVLGKEVKDFESEYSKYNKVKYSLGVANGLDALHLALVSLGITVGDEVIVPSNTFIATVMAISYTGATPIFVEPNIRTYNLDPLKIEEKITSKTKAIVPVHLYGQACQMDLIMAISKKYTLYIIEDNAQAHGATFNAKPTGSFGDVNATSFYPSKNLGALGDAGAITTNAKKIYTTCLALRNYGSHKKYYNKMIGYNSRLDELQASVLSVKLAFMNTWTQERIQLALWYTEELKELTHIVLPHIAKGATHVYHLYTIRTTKRNQLQKYLDSKSIETLIHYPIPPHLQQAFRSLGYKKGDFPIAEKIAETTLSLPLYIGMTREQVAIVSQHIKQFFNM